MKLVDRIQEFISKRRLAYVRTFDSVYGAEVLYDLAQFCRANTSCFHQDARAHAVAEGRREVWLRIQRHLKLSDEQLWALHGAAPTSKRSDSDD